MVLGLVQSAQPFTTGSKESDRGVTHVFSPLELEAASAVYSIKQDPKSAVAEGTLKPQATVKPSVSCGYQGMTMMQSFSTTMTTGVSSFPTATSFDFLGRVSKRVKNAEGTPKPQEPLEGQVAGPPKGPIQPNPPCAAMESKWRPGERRRGARSVGAQA